MSDDHVVFASAVEAMGKILAVSPATYETATKLGFNFKKPETAYQRKTWEQLLPLASQGLFPKVSRAEALRSLGRLTVEHYGTGLVGSALFALLKLIGPMRAIHRTRRNFRTSNNYTECRITERSPREVLLWMNEIEFSDYTAGVLEAGIAAAGAKNVRVALQGVEGDGTNFLVTWD